MKCSCGREVKKELFVPIINFRERYDKPPKLHYRYTCQCHKVIIISEKVWKELAK